MDWDLMEVFFVPTYIVVDSGLYTTSSKAVVQDIQMIVHGLSFFFVGYTTRAMLSSIYLL